MYDFRRTNKISGVNWLKNAIENVKIKVKLKPQHGIMSLPKFEDYASNADTVNLETFDKIDEYTFSWQEKVFSLYEINRYSDVHNCTSATELSYHNVLSNSEHQPCKIFTYVHEDFHLPLPADFKKQSNVEINTCFEKINLTDRLQNALTTDSSSMGHLFRSEENIDMNETPWRAMHIVIDNSEYNGDLQLIYKQEAVLMSLYYNLNNNCLLLSPDGNSLEMNPYSVETVSGVTLDYEYSVEVMFQDEEDNADELVMLLQKLGKKWEKKHKQLVNFSMPPLGRKLYQVTLEIVSATDFDMDGLYIEFNIKLPEGTECKDTLKGRTSITQSLKTNDSKVWNFGHPVDLTLEMDGAKDPQSLQVFLEVISTDWWGCHRTEGYSYLPLSLEPGIHKKTLSCSRPEEKDSVEAESRRFFVGGCHLIKDLEVLAKPQLQDGNFIFRSTGSVHLRWQVVSQSPIPGYKVEKVPSTSASALLMGTEAVLRQYRKARAKLAAATKDLRGSGDGSDG